MSKEFSCKVPPPSRKDDLITLISPAGKTVQVKASNIDSQLHLLQQNWKYSFNSTQKSQIAKQMSQAYSNYALPKHSGKFQEWLIDTVTNTGEQLGFVGIGLDPEVIIAIEEAFEEAISFDLDKFHQALFRRLH